MNISKSEDNLYKSAIESASIFNGAVAECAYSSGLLHSLSNYSSINDVIQKMSFLSEKKDQLAYLMEILVKLKYVQKKEIYGVNAYSANKDFIQTSKGINGTINRYQTNFNLLKPWYGETHVDKIRDSNIDFLGQDLNYLRSSTAKIKFSRQFIDVWKTNLSNPLYDFGRILAIKLLVERGSRFLDLACGLGYGAQCLDQYTEEKCYIVGIDKSHDMLEEAKQLIFPNSDVRFILHDLNKGLPQNINQVYDGILFNGAFHFIEDKRTMLQELWNVLRPGGLLVIGHCFCESGFEDQPMHNFYFSMLENPLYLMSFGDLKTMISEVQFEIFKEYHRGSHSYVIAQKLHIKNPIKKSFIY